MQSIARSSQSLWMTLETRNQSPVLMMMMMMMKMNDVILNL